ncbi:MAG TPA: RNA polymerase sigma factor [Solirubrobacterales bacterium]|nr:RNA polymerase sigma factor [Solirubrobacterales bacterium]
MEASALTHASQRGLLARRSPLLKLQGDAKLIAMVRAGNASAFETIVDRYQGRLLGFCRQMLGSTEDAEDVLQEVFVNAHRAMLGDDREINLRPWLYRIARNRCLNHLRKPTADAQESMDFVPVVDAASTAERVHNREEFRQILGDVNKLPETQRAALLLREMDAMSYEEIAQAMDTSVPSVKSLLVRARISLTEASQARQLTCGEVRLELAEAAEGLRKVSGPVRRHVRDCEECADFRSQIRNSSKALAALVPVGPLVALKGFIAAKLGLGGAGAGAGATAGGGGAAGAAAGAGTAGAVGGMGAAALGGGGAAAGGLGAMGGAIGTKAVAGVVTAAVITAGAAVEVKQNNSAPVTPLAVPAKNSGPHQIPAVAQAHSAEPKVRAVAAPPVPPVEAAPAEAPPAQPPAEEPAATATEPAPTPPLPAEEPAASGEGAGQSLAGSETPEAGAGLTGAAASAGSTAGAHGAGSTVVVTVGGGPPPAAPPAPSPAPAPESAPAPPPPPAEMQPPAAAPPAEVPAGSGSAAAPVESEAPAEAPAEPSA